MLNPEIEKILNEQIAIEGQASYMYLALAAWCDVKGFSGAAKFLYEHSDEERMHMLKLIRFVNERGGFAMVPAFEQPTLTYPSLVHAFKELLNHEIHVSESINKLVDIALQEKDYATHNFLQWYVAEQIEEEALARTLNDKLEMIGDEKSGLYLFDKDILTVSMEIEGGE